MNETGEPEFNGVVLSEMKGAMSDPDEILQEYMESVIFPNMTYRWNSGGAPTDIPKLSQKELSDFYATFYHPSNAQVLLYGTRTSAENCLIQLDEYLKTFDARPDIRLQSQIELQPMLDISPKLHRVPFEAEDANAPRQMLMSWLISGAGNMDDSFQAQNRLAYTVLEQLLMNDKFGVLYLALQKSGLVGSVDGGIEMSSYQWTFQVQLTSVDANNTLAVQNLVQDTLQMITKDGFHHEDIESAINTVEFGYRDISSFT